MGICGWSRPVPRWAQLFLVLSKFAVKDLKDFLGDFSPHSCSMQPSWFPFNSAWYENQLPVA